MGNMMLLSSINLNSSFLIALLINLLIYLQKWKQLFSVGLLYNIKVTEDTTLPNTTRNSVTFFRQKFCVCNNCPGWILPGELSSVTPPPSSFPGYLSLSNVFWWISKSFKKHKALLTRRNLDSHLIFEIYSNLIFVKVQQSGMSGSLHRLWEIASTYVNDISDILSGWFQL